MLQYIDDSQLYCPPNLNSFKNSICVDADYGWIKH